MPPLPDLSHITLADLTRLDIVALSIMALSALWGLTRGFATELAGLLAWVGAIVLTYRFHGLLEPYLTPYLHQAALAGSASTAILFVVVLLFFTMIGARVGAAARGVLFGGVDRILGAVFGVARGYVALIVLYLLAGSFFGSWMSYVMQGSLIGPYIAAGATHLTGYLPHFLQPHLASEVTSGHEASL
ncbi:CvpA family protein [Gluconobacter kondonii]|uniref:CvpA family protein n=1 Tax=Gluconobacter kondonii TaxID=941463 RepID=UPI001B8AC325|nr:CvpA family protein [Gluconobacter kondonii]MBS1064737.1 CvpA family protein [Gluconobacter kondonii]MBS1083235.1 CvpA family protein [Gluconobacter kondonii]